MEIVQNKYLEKLLKSYFLQQLILYVLVYCILILDDIVDGDFTKPVFVASTLLFLFGCVLAEFNLQVFMPKVLQKGKIKLYFLGLPVLVVAYSWLLILIGSNIMNGQLYTNGELDAFGFMMAQYFILLVVSTLYQFNFKYIEANRKIYQLTSIQHEQKEAELMALKSQINPHFLFNTLNNIYSFSVSNNPETPNLIMKLSELTSYVLYESDKETVALRDEIEFLENFIELEKIRLDEYVQIDFDRHDCDIDTQIAPLLFVPIVENVFNHGLRSQSSADYAKISLKVENNIVVFKAENTYAQIPESKKTSGIGLKNLKKRLDLIYPDYELLIKEKDGLFVVEMIINLDITTLRETGS